MKGKIAGLLLIAAALLLTAFLVGHEVGERNAQPVLYPAEPMADMPTVQSAGRLNLNTATHEALCELPGIGEKLADQILAYRQENGGIKSVWELEDIPGIGSGKLEKLLPLICAE